MAGAGDDHRLNLLLPLIQVSDFAGCLISVFFMHRQVHENQTVDGVSRKRLLHFLHAVVAVMCRVDEAIHPGELNHVLDSHSQTLDVEHLVVDDQDTAPVCPIRKSYVLELENVVDLVAFLVRGVSDALLRLHYIVLRIIPFALVFDLLQLTLLRNVDLGRHFISGIVDDPLVLVLDYVGVDLLQLYDKGEGRAFAPCRLADDLAPELSHNFLADV